MKHYIVDLSWRVHKSYDIDAETEEEAVNAVRKMIDDGEVCVWTDGFEASDENDEVIVATEE